MRLINRSTSHFSLAPALLGVCLLAGGAAAHAGEGAQRLERFFTDLSAMRAEFDQTLFDPEGKVIEESQGVLLLRRPGRFRLEYRAPYEQLYVADGQKVWMYDRDLEQVTVRAQEEALGSTPALLLSSRRPLSEDFAVRELGPREGLVWVELVPKQAGEGAFESIRLGLGEQWVKVMAMQDGFGQVTRLVFTEIERNPRFADDAFVFEPPAGVDVIGEAPARAP